MYKVLCIGGGDIAAARLLRAGKFRIYKISPMSEKSVYEDGVFFTGRSSAETPLGQLKGEDTGPFSTESLEANKLKIIRLAKESERIVDNIGVLEPTALVAAKFWVFNLLLNHPNLSERHLAAELAKIKLMSEKEKVYRQEKIYPTIGVELEIDEEDNIRVEYDHMLEALHVPHYWDNPDEKPHLLETNLDYSYSPQVQGRILMEAVKVGLVEVTKAKGKNTAGPYKYKSESLHVNFGMPCYTQDTLKEYSEYCACINDLLTYAYSSPSRLFLKKQPYTKKLKTGSNFTGPKVYRWELSGMEYSGRNTFRMLEDAQRLMGVFVSHLKQKEGSVLSHKATQMASMFNDLRDKIERLLAIHGLQIDHFKKIGREDVLRELGASDLQENARDLVNRSSKKVYQITGL